MEGLQNRQEPRQAIETALYFPYIRVPRTPWFTQVLLYWDQAASIIPKRLLYKEDGVNDYMRDLNRAGLLNYIRPEVELERCSGTFEEAFIKLLDEGDPPPTEGWRTYTRLHADKMTDEVSRHLERRGLAAPIGSGRNKWWMVETTTAGTYMACLASAISGADTQHGTLPVTDQLDALATLGPNSSDFRAQLAHLRYSTITRALPAPTGAVSAAELVKFKTKNFDQLRRCRTYLDGKLADIASVDDPHVREVRAASALQEIQDEVASLKEKMERRRWPQVALVGFGGVIAPALGTMATLATGGGALAVGLAVGAGVVQVGTAAHAAVNLIRTPRFDGRAPLAYAALASQL